MDASLNGLLALADALAVTADNGNVGDAAKVFLDLEQLERDVNALIVPAKVRGIEAILPDVVCQALAVGCHGEASSRMEVLLGASHAPVQVARWTSTARISRRCCRSQKSACGIWAGF